MNQNDIKSTLNVLQIIAQPVWGGGEQFVLDLSEGLVDSGYNVSLVSRKSNIIQAKFSGFKNIHFLSLSSLFDIPSIVKLGRIIKQESIDVVHVHMFKHAFIALFACKLFRCKNTKVVLTRHLVRKAKTLYLYKWLYRQINSIVFVSHCSKDAFLSTLPRMREDKLHVIYNSIHPKRLKMLQSGGEQKSRPGQPLRLGFLGSVLPEKGIEVLIEAIAILKQEYPDIRLEVAGLINEPYLQTLNSLIQRQDLGDNVSLLGFCNDVAGFIKTMDIGILPSICPESFCLSVLEFMSVGKPVITTNNGAQKEIITDRYDGILVNPGDPQAIVGAVVSLMRDEGLKIKIMENAPKTVTGKFSFPLFLNKYITLYHAI